MDFCLVDNPPSTRSSMADVKVEIKSSMSTKTLLKSPSTLSIKVPNDDDLLHSDSPSFDRADHPLSPSLARTPSLTPTGTLKTYDFNMSPHPPGTIPSGADAKAYLYLCD